MIKKYTLIIQPGLRKHAWISSGAGMNALVRFHYSLTMMDLTPQGQIDSWRQQAAVPLPDYAKGYETSKLYRLLLGLREDGEHLKGIMTAAARMETFIRFNGSQSLVSETRFYAASAKTSNHLGVVIMDTPVDSADLKLRGIFLR
jgi:hypothetical protein